MYYDQTCALMFPTNDAVDVRFIDVEQQTNNSDCGVHAIAVTTSLSSQSMCHTLKQQLVDCIA